MDLGPEDLDVLPRRRHAVHREGVLERAGRSVVGTVVVESPRLTRLQVLDANVRVHRARVRTASGHSIASDGVGPVVVVGLAVTLEAFRPSVSLRDVAVLPLDLAVLPRRHGRVAGQRGCPAHRAAGGGDVLGLLDPIVPSSGLPPVLERCGASSMEGAPLGDALVVVQRVGDVVDSILTRNSHLHVLGVGVGIGCCERRQSRNRKQHDERHHDHSSYCHSCGP